MRPCNWRRGCTSPGTEAVSLVVGQATYLCRDHHDALLGMVDSVPIKVVRA